MVSDPSFHGPTGIIVLHSKSNVRNQSSIIFWDRALHLINPLKKLLSRSKKRLKSVHSPIATNQQKQNHKIARYDHLRKHNQTLNKTLISLNGIKRLFSILESRPRMRAACRKLRLVAARAFIFLHNS